MTTQANDLNSKVRLADFDSGKGLNRGASKVKEAIWYMVKVFIFLSALPYPSAFRVKVLRLFGAEVGSNVTIKPRVNIHFPWKLHIGNDVWIGEEAFILNFEPVQIGNNVCISQRSFICCGNHNFRSPDMPYRNGPINLKDGCWVGANSFIGPGVTIGYDSVITVGTIISANVDDNLVVSTSKTYTYAKRWK